LNYKDGNLRNIKDTNNFVKPTPEIMSSSADQLHDLKLQETTKEKADNSNASTHKEADQTKSKQLDGTKNLTKSILEVGSHNTEDKPTSNKTEMIPQSEYNQNELKYESQNRTDKRE